MKCWRTAVAGPKIDTDEAAPRPRLRGRIHPWALVGWLPLGVLIILHGDTPRERITMFVYVLSMATMLGASSLYHWMLWTERMRWTELAKLVVRRIDHAMIFFSIAGTATPLWLVGGRWTSRLVLIAWAAALLGAILELFRPDANEVRAVICALLAWGLPLAMAPELKDRILP